MRGQRVRFNEAGDGEVDENFWAQAAADQAAGRMAEDDESKPAPFETQFFNDDDDVPAFDDLYEGDVDGDGIGQDAGEEDLLAATQGMTRRVRPESVKYAKRAKRVDVRKLKENIWKGLDIKVSKVEEGDEEMDIDDQPVTDPSEERQFSQVIRPPTIVSERQDGGY